MEADTLYPLTRIIRYEMEKIKRYDGKVIPLEIVTGAIEMADDSGEYYLDLEAMETVYIGDTLLTGIDYAPTIELIDRNRDRFMHLPTKYDIHEYSIMEEFVYSLEHGDARDYLESAICGKGAFRRFKDGIRRFGIAQRWYGFQADAYKEIAIRWCKDHDLAYTINSAMPITLYLLNEDFSVCKVSDYSKVDLTRPFCFIEKTDEENSLICETEAVPNNTTEREDGWRAFRIMGTLDFSLVGILAKISELLAKAEIGIFAISTYNTDYILTKEADYDRALQTLTENGYEISGSS